MGDAAMASLSRLSLYWPFTWRGAGAIALGVLLAKWIWILFAPQPVYTSSAPVRTAAMEAGQLFGVAAETETTSQGVALPNVQLLGVFAANRGKPGFAILKLDGSRQMGLAEGEEVVAGTRLIEVHANHVVLERAGVQQRVELENKFAASPASSKLMAMPAYGAAAGRVRIHEKPDHNIIATPPAR